MPFCSGWSTTYGPLCAPWAVGGHDAGVRSAIGTMGQSGAMPDLSELQLAVTAERRARGFTSDSVRILALLIEELGEVARELKRTWSPNYDDLDAERLASEIADVFVLLSALASEWDPCLAENQKIIGTPEEFYDEEHPFYFPDAMADRTIEWLHGVRAQDARKPFFVYYSTGCSHAPHHVTRHWADKYKGEFDQGWDRLRAQTFARQKELGVIPADAELTARDPAFPGWDDVPDKLKRFYARQMEVCGVFRERGPQRRAGDRRDRAAGRARQHADHLDLG